MLGWNIAVIQFLKLSWASARGSMVVRLFLPAASRSCFPYGPIVDRDSGRGLLGVGRLLHRQDRLEERTGSGRGRAQPGRGGVVKHPHRGGGGLAVHQRGSAAISTSPLPAAPGLGADGQDFLFRQRRSSGGDSRYGLGVCRARCLPVFQAMSRLTLYPRMDSRKSGNDGEGVDGLFRRRSVSYMD